MNYDMDESGDEHVASTIHQNPTPESDGGDPGIGNGTSGSNSSSSNPTSIVSANAAPDKSGNVQRTCIVMLQVSLRANTTSKMSKFSGQRRPQVGRECDRCQQY